jgi:hypothetical protein
MTRTGKQTPGPEYGAHLRIRYPCQLGTFPRMTGKLMTSRIIAGAAVALVVIVAAGVVRDAVRDQVRRPRRSDRA